MKLTLRAVIANLSSREGHLRKFFASSASAKNPWTQKDFRTTNLEVFTDNLNTKVIEGWIGVPTPDLDLGEECGGTAFSIWVSFEDAGSF